MDHSREGILKEARTRMVKAVEHLENDLQGIRTGRANAGLVGHIKVDYYGSMTPISQMAQVSVPDPKTILIKPFDTTQTAAIEKAILASNLGITPQSDGKAIRLPVPMLTQEQRKKLCSHVKDLAEVQRVAIRNIRRECNKHAQAGKKEAHLSEDEVSSLEEKIQELTHQYENEVQKLASKKTKEITTA